MAILLGPVLQFLGIQDNRWCVSVLVVTDTATATAPALKGALTAGPFTQLCQLQSGARVWRATLSVVQDPTCPDLVAWSQLLWAQRRKAKWTPALQTQVTAFFENLYLTKWA